MKADDEIERDIRAGAVAHAIRLGKRPKVGMVMWGKAQLKSIEEADFHAGRIDQATPIGEMHEIEFTVTAEDIANAERAINDQRAKYREPKMTTLELWRKNPQAAKRVNLKDMPHPQNAASRLDQLLTSLSYHKPTEDQTQRIEQLRAAQKAYADFLVSLTPAGREQSVSITEFESSCMWAVKAIVLEKPNG